MGRGTLIYGALCYGATGAIASCTNVAPRMCVDIYEKYMAGDLEGCLKAQFALAPLRKRTSEVGAGNVTKLANQVIVALNIAAVLEALVLASKAGVEPELVYQAHPWWSSRKYCS